MMSLSSSKGIQGFSFVPSNPAVEAEETTEKVEKEEEEDATGSEKAHNFVKLVRADGEELEEMDGTKENPWIPFDEDKDIIDYQYEVKAERENQEDMEEPQRASKLPEPKHASLDSPNLIIEPPASYVGSGATAGFSHYLVRFTLTITLSSAIALKYFLY